MARPKNSATNPGGVGGSLYGKMVNGATLTAEEVVQASCRQYVSGNVFIGNVQMRFNKEEDQFFDGRSHLAAREVCSDCPIRKRCLEIALELEEPWGVWGGATVKDREKLHARMEDEGLTVKQAVDGFNHRVALEDEKFLLAENLRKQKKKEEREERRTEMARRSLIQETLRDRMEDLLQQALELTEACPAGHRMVEANVFRKPDGELKCLTCYRDELVSEARRDLRREAELRRQRRMDDGQ